MSNELLARIVSVLDSTTPQVIETIRKKAGLKNWESTKALCLELVVAGRVKCVKTSRGWVFWIDASSTPNI